MTSRTTARFREALAELPDDVRAQARRAYQLFRQDPFHPGLHFTPVHPMRPIYSVRISREYRALGTREDGIVVWFWIGSHAEYDRLVSRS